MTMHLLVVCTANICRSPMAEHFLRRAAERRSVDATISSAGLLPGGRGASPGSALAMLGHGMDLDSHQSRQINRELIEAADLVVGMEVRHIREAAVMAPARFGRVFTLRELVRRSSEVGPRGDLPLGEWLDQLGQGRSAASLMAAHDLDIDDPYGGPPEGYPATASLLHDLTDRLADALWGPA